MPRLRMPHLPSFRDVDPVALGVVCLVLVGTLTTAMFVVGGLDPFARTYPISAVFDDASGLRKDAEVRLAGVDVGRVTGRHADFERGQVIVTMEIDSGVELGTGMRAEVVASSLLGGYHVRLSGPVVEPFLEDLDGDDPRRRIPLERTQAATSLVATLSDSTTTIDAIDIDAVNRVMTELAGATSRNHERLPQLLESFSTVSSLLVEREEELRQLITNGEQLATALNAKDEEIILLIDAATVLLETLDARRAELATILGDGSSAVVTLTDTIVEHRAAIDAVLTDVHVVLEGVGRNVSTINTSLAYAGPLFTLLSASVSDDGGFDVSVEGLVATGDQLRGILGVLLPEMVP